MENTIVAISTGLNSESGIGIVRMSGNDAVKIADKIFISKDGKKVYEYNSHTIHYGWIKENNKIIDEVLLLLMFAPKTYTKEDVVEISAHGGITVLKKILELCIKNGAQLAQPGEFTKRAFLNGRIDLIQAEAVCDIIRAKTEQSLEFSLQQLKGNLSNKLNNIKNKLLDLIAHLELNLDYPDDENIEIISSEKLHTGIKSLIYDINNLVNTAYKGKIYREGVNISIIGKPNVGKSSLLNYLLAQERAIVTDIPGTTRDIISETFNLKGIPVTIMDTAGIRIHYSDFIEKIAADRTKQVFEKSQIIIFIIDLSTGINDEDINIIDFIKGSSKKILVVLNKLDLISNKENIDKIKSKISLFLNKNITEFVITSIIKLQGLEELTDKLYQLILKNVLISQDQQEDVVITNFRHEQNLLKCIQNLEIALDMVIKKQPLEIISISMHSALNALDEIIGKTTPDEILNRIFSQFCVGK